MSHLVLPALFSFVLRMDVFSCSLSVVDHAPIYVSVPVCPQVDQQADAVAHSRRSQHLCQVSWSGAGVRGRVGGELLVQGAVMVVNSLVSLNA